MEESKIRITPTVTKEMGNILTNIFGSICVCEGPLAFKSAVLVGRFRLVLRASVFHGNVSTMCPTYQVVP